LSGRHQSEQIASLGAVIVAVSMIVPGGVTRQRKRRFVESLALNRSVETIWFIINAPASISIHAHEAVPMVIHNRTTRPINRNQVVIDS
jgi:hypothetical protein